VTRNRRLAELEACAAEHTSELAIAESELADRVAEMKAAADRGDVRGIAEAFRAGIEPAARSRRLRGGREQPMSTEQAIATLAVLGLDPDGLIEGIRAHRPGDPVAPQDLVHGRLEEDDAWP
jgi:hypothetical protein